MEVDVGSVDEFPPGEVRVVEVEGRSYGVVLWDDTPYAFLNVCPHQLAPIARGTVRRPFKTPCGIGTLEVDVNALVVVCPWHRWEFDLTDGRTRINQRGPRLSTRLIRVTGDRIILDAR